MMSKFTIQHLGIAVVALLLVVAPFALAGQDYVLRLLTMAATYAIAVYGFNIILGLTGQLSLAHGGFFGIGIYMVGLLTTKQEWPFWAAFAAAIVTTAVLGFLCGVVALRTREEYFAIFTMAVGFIIYLVLSRWESVTNGMNGISGIPFPEGFGIVDFENPIVMYFLVLLFLAAAAYITHAIRRSGVGRTLIAIRTSEDLANSIGVNVGLNKQLAFAASTTFAGIAGGLFATVQGFVGPTSASVNLTFELLMFILVGGLGTVMGPIVGSFVVTFLFETMQDFQSYRFIVLGPVIIALVIFAPRGIVGYLNAFVARRRRARARRSGTSAPSVQDRGPSPEEPAGSSPSDTRGAS